MERIVVCTCTKCKKSFTVSGTVKNRKVKLVAQRATCPYCSEPNEVMWTIADRWAVIKG